jgi:DNA-binding transcriptional MerR regulator
MSKAAEAFRSISEVADELEVPKHVLRFWEAKFPQIRPMKRGGGRRYYRPEDMELLRGIRRLLHAEGYTIKGVQKILREQGVDHVKKQSRESEPAAGAKAGARGRQAVRDARPEERTRRPDGRPPASLATVPSPPSRSSERRARVEALIVELEACRRLLVEEAAAPASTTARRAGSQRA